MPSYEAWKTLLPNEWASCVRIHNLPFSFTVLKTAAQTAFVPELRRSADTWNYADFMDSSSRYW